MKTISVSDEMYDFLVQTGREILTQDHRCTAKPIVFLVYTKHEEMRPEGYAEKEKIIDEEGNEQSIEDIIECILDDLKEVKEKNILFVDDGESESMLKEVKHLGDLLEIIDIDDYIKFFRDHWTYVHFDEEHRYGGEGAFFLTQKACETHIAGNKHNYREPIAYVEHAFRNPEIKQLCNFLTDLAKASLEKPEAEPVSTIRAFSSFLNPDELKDIPTQEPDIGRA